MQAKTCTKCERERSLEAFGISRRSKDGYKNWCRDCCRTHYEQNKDRIRLQHAAYRKANLATIQARTRIRRAERREEHNASKRAKYRENPEIFKARSKTWSANNRSTCNAMKRAWREANPEKVKAIRARSKRDPDMRRAIDHRRRARELNAPGRHTKGDIEAIRALQGGKCAVCGKSVASKYDVDHIQPLAKGGSNDRRNLQILCPTCNKKKASKDPIQFMQERGLLI